MSRNVQFFPVFKSTLSSEEVSKEEKLHWDPPLTRWSFQTWVTRFKSQNQHNTIINFNINFQSWNRTRIKNKITVPIQKHMFKFWIFLLIISYFLLWDEHWKCIHKAITFQCFQQCSGNAAEIHYNTDMIATGSGRAPRPYNSYNYCPCARPAHVTKCWSLTKSAQKQQKSDHPALIFIMMFRVNTLSTRDCHWQKSLAQTPIWWPAVSGRTWQVT